MNIIEPVAPITGTASLTVTCAAPCVNATGAVTLNATHTVATFTLTPGTTLAPGTLYTGTITGATALCSGVATAGPLHLAIHHGGDTLGPYSAPSIGDRSRNDDSRADGGRAQQHRHQRNLHHQAAPTN